MFSDSVRVAAENRRPFWLLLGLLVLSLVVASLTQGTYDSGDSINHYLYARYAFETPHNFLDSWSKPLVVQLMAVPAQLGLRGVMALQCLLVAAAAWLAYLAARRLALPWPWLAILFCYASPDYFRIQFSGLTEPLFSTILMAAVALAILGRASWGAVVLSFLPFARSEGYLLIGVYGLYLLLSQQWRALPWLALGFVVYGIAGIFEYHDFFWAFTHNAYPLRNPNYGSGTPWHFIISLPNTIGWVLYVLFWLGGLRMIWEWMQPRLRQREGFLAELLLVYGSIVVFIGAHTLFWALGIFASFGLTRVLCGVVPLVALVALRGLLLVSQLSQSEVVRCRIRVGVAVAVVGFLFCGARAAFRWQRDFARASDQILADEAVRWAATQAPAPHYASAHPYFAIPLNINPFGAKHSYIQAIRDHQPLPAGTLIFWDEWYAVVEMGVPLDSLRGNPAYQQLWYGSMPRIRHKPSTDSVRMAVFRKL
ncbi:hypothetical protein FY528_10410 [Hymenobacter lutimineralis]|uniref:Glycosyltransferase RgtA/B/C/D-like domain-containing protein n=1 Tax=Hymenobacter lutimineralis TaxID=2606448 RepID=A0A5D6V4U8_9BACT|nr:hypothetical protein [Hymenobacter lutimineralis]TYZ09644.1 hypothetical protein FY528_10410 [Hymenobacter lutimineralis]